MANTYTQIHIHIVFAVKYRRALICESWQTELYKYITGTIQNQEHKVLAINGVENHIHILVGLRPIQSVSNLVKSIKENSSKWINKKRLANSRFHWQSGFGAFSVSPSDLDRVIRYILNQKEHHRKKCFKQEYDLLLRKEGIDFDDKYTFKDPI